MSKFKVGERVCLKDDATSVGTVLKVPAENNYKYKVNFGGFHTDKSSNDLELCEECYKCKAKDAEIAQLKAAMKAL